jgi:adhesin transport system outer membrane protein
LGVLAGLFALFSVTVTHAADDQIVVPKDQQAATVLPAEPRPSDSSISKKQDKDNSVASEKSTTPVTRKLPPKSEVAGAKRRRSSTGGQGSMSLVQAVKMAILRNPDVQSAIAILRREGANLTIAQSARYPQISYCAGMGSADSCSSGTTSVNGAKTIGITADLLLYDFGRTSGLINAASSDERRAQADIESSREKVATEVTTAYIAILKAGKLRQAAQDYVSSLETLKLAIEQRAESGVSNRADVIRAEVAVDAAKAAVISAETDERGTRATLVNLTGIDFGTLQPVDIEFSRLNRNLNLDGLASHPDVVSAEKSAASARYQAEAEEAALYPRISVQGYGGTAPLDGMKGSGGAMLTMKGDLYRGGAQVARISAAKSSETAARLRIDSIKLASRSKFGVAFQNERGAIDRIAIAKRQLANSVTARDLYFEQYTLGKRTLTELLDAESGINGAKIGQIGANYDRQVAILDQAVAIGTVARGIIGANLVAPPNPGIIKVEKTGSTTVVAKKASPKSAVQKPVTAVAAAASF